LMSVESVQAGAMRMGAARMTILPGEGALFDGATQKMAGRVKFMTEMSGSSRGVKVGVKNLEGVAAVDLSAGPTVMAEVKVSGGSVVEKTWGATDISADVPVVWNGAAPTTGGVFAVNGATMGGHALPAVAGTLRVVNKSVAVTASAEVAKGATVSADGNVEWTKTGLHGRVATTMPAYTLTDETALGKVWTAAAEMGVTGTISANGEVLFDGPLVKPRFTAAMKNVKVTSAKYDLSVEGANGSVTIDDLSPLSGPGAQKLSVEKLHLGKLDLSKGEVDFRVERPESVHIERSQWSWGGGRIYTYDLRLNPAKPQEVEAVVYADRLDLQKLIGALAEGKASGDGQLYGRLPVKVNWPDISFGEGFLYATGSGGIAIGSKADAVGAILDASDPRFATDPTFGQVKARMIDALRNFSYDTLKVDFVQKESGLTAAITVNGKGKTGPKPQELSLTVNVNGVDALLSEWLVIRKALGSFGQ
jgi:hypothetical protein